MRHIYAGYLFMISLGYDDSARICLTHSFPYKNIGAYNGQNDCSEEETEYIKNYIDMLEYNDYDKLIQRMNELGIPEENLEWYTNLRKFGGCYHSGFGLGFERLIMYLTGVDNIRDVIPYPRTPNNCNY